MRIYIAHPYTGDEERNRERALRAEKLLRKITPNVEFFNPVGRLTEQFKGLSYAEVMAHCLLELTECDGIVFCGDWEESTGCRFEAYTAEQLQLPRWYGAEAYTATWARVKVKAEREEVVLWQRQHARRSISRFFATRIGADQLNKGEIS